MASEWPDHRLDEITEFIFDCPHSTPKWTEEGVLVLRNQNIRNGRLDLSSLKFTNEAGFKARIKRAKPVAGDLVFTREAPMGEVCQVPDGLRCCLGQRMVLIRADGRVADSRYLLFALQSPYLQHQISWNEGTGTTVSNIRIPNIQAFKIPSPPLPEQKAIAHVLGALDDRIELNRRMNETLEAMAQALFKSWFVDFDPVIDNALASGKKIPEELSDRAKVRAALGDKRQLLPEEIRTLFPNQFTYSDELGWIPTGWEVKPIDEALEVNPRVPFKKGEVAKFVDMKALPTSGFSVADVITKSYSGGAKFNKGDVLLARITPCLENGKTAVVDFLDDGEVGFGSTEFIVLRGKGAIHTPFVACLARHNRFRDHCTQSMVGSSGRQRVQNACFSYYYLALPPGDELLKAFNDLANGTFTKYVHLREQSKVLANLRDTLLPKLLSGELRIPDAEKISKVAK